MVKAHGLAGEVIVELTTDRTERLDAGSILRTEGRALTVAHARRHQQRWIVVFEGVTKRNQAEALRGTQLLAPPIDDPNTLWVDELLGCAVVEDTSRRHLGTVVAIEANPASDLLVLDGGGLIPLRFVIGREPGTDPGEPGEPGEEPAAGMTLIAKIPDGLLD